MKPRINCARNCQRFINLLAFVGISGTTIDFDAANNRYNLSSVNIFTRVLFCAIRFNYAVKLIYLFFLILRGFPNLHLEFLDRMTIGLFLLLTMQIIMGEMFWARKYPFFEIISSGWRVQNEIVQKLSSAEELESMQNQIVIRKAALQS